jgi:hypothetical protein
MMRLVKNEMNNKPTGPLADISYTQPIGRSRSSNAHVGESRRTGTSAKSSIPKGFNVFNFSNTFLNEKSSNLFLLRWDIPDSLLDHKLTALFDGNREALDNFVVAEVKVVQKLRDLYAFAYNLHSKKANELTEFQPVFQLYVKGLLKGVQVGRTGIKRTVIAANETELEAKFILKAVDNHGDRMVTTESGAGDLMVLIGDDVAIDLTAENSNVDTIVELKRPFGPMHHTANRKGLDQITCEVEGLAQTSQSNPGVVKGVMTDLFALSIHIRIHRQHDDKDKVYHCVSHRVVEAAAFVKRLLLIFCCAITDEDMDEECISGH